MRLKNDAPVSHMPVGNISPIGVTTSTPSAPAPSQPRIPPTGGGRSGIGRLQKAGMPGVPSTPGGYDSSGINPGAGRSGGSAPTRVPTTGGQLPPRVSPAVTKSAAPSPLQSRSGSILSKLGRGKFR